MVKLLAFLSLAIIIDVTFGKLCQYMAENAKSGGPAKRNYEIRKSTADIMMYGSSRMAHHYVASQISDSLKCTCFNAGEDGCGILWSYAIFTMQTKRYTPKVILYDLSPYDYETDNGSSCGFIKQYPEDPDVMAMLKELKPLDRYKIHSGMYRFNSSFIGICLSIIWNGDININMGYEPTRGILNYDPEVDTDDSGENETDALKLKYFEKLIAECKDMGIRLICVCSPIYHTGKKYKIPGALLSLLGEYGVQYVDFSDDDICYDRSKFSDSAHLNDDGAHAFTEKMIELIR